MSLSATSSYSLVYGTLHRYKRIVGLEILSLVVINRDKKSEENQR